MCKYSSPDYNPLPFSISPSPMDTPKLLNPPLPIFTMWFIFIYISGYFVVFRNWNKKHKPEASSCLMSLAHSTPAVILSISSFLQPQIGVSQLDFVSPNTSFQNLVLEHSIAYFLTDLLHYMVFVPGDALFIVHHVATLYVLTTCRYLFGHGAPGVLGILVLAEVTSTCQNTWSLARYQKTDSVKAALLLELLSPYFYCYYTVVRGILGPVFVYKMGLAFACDLDDGMIPMWGRVSWIVVIAAGIGLSLLWVVHLWVDLYRQRDDKKLS